MGATYASLREAGTAVREQSGTTADDGALMDALRYVTQRIDETVRISAPFLPVVGTRYFTSLPLDAGGDVNGRELHLDRPLLEVQSVVNVGPLAVDAYVRLPKAETPTWRLRLRALAAAWTYSADEGPEDAIAVTGAWGYHSDYPNAWETVDSVPTGGLTASATTITVTAVGAFSPGMLLRIGAEYLAVTAVSAATNTVTVQRGQRGTTAASATAGATVAAYAVEPSIAQAAARWAAYVLVRAGKFADSEFDGVTAVRYPKDVPPDVAGALAQYGRIGRFRGV